MEARRAAAILLVALLFPNAPRHPLRLQHFTPLTMEPAGAQLKLYPSRLAFEWFAASGDAFVLRTRTEVQVIDTRTLHVVQSYAFPRRTPTCALGFDGAAVVVLQGCEKRGATNFTVWRLAGHDRRAVRVRGLAPVVDVADFAVGDGRWFVARTDGDVDVIDLRSGRVTHHHGLLAGLARGSYFPRVVWLGGHRLGLNGAVVDVRTWHRRILAAGAEGLAAAEGKILAYGENGITVFDDNLQLYRRIARGQTVAQATIHDGVVYAGSPFVWELYDLRTGTHIDTVIPHTPWEVRLVP